MPKILPSKIHPKTQEILNLVRKPSSKQRINAFFDKLSELERRKVALDLHENIELDFYQQFELQTKISELYVKHMNDFEKLMGSFVKHSTQAQGIQIATDIIEQYDINQFAKDDINLMLVATKDCNVNLVNALLEKGADPTLESSLKHWSAWNFLIGELAYPTKPELADNYQLIFDLFTKYNVNPAHGHALHFEKELNAHKLSKHLAKLPQLKFVNQIFEVINSSIVDQFSKLFSFATDQLSMAELIDEYQVKYNCDIAAIDSLLNTRDIDGNTPLMKATIKGDLTAIRTLLEYNIDTNIQDVEGNTALHHAVKSGNYEISSLLLNYRNANNPLHEASIIIKNNENITPLDLIIENNFFELRYRNQAYKFSSKLIDYISQNKTNELNDKLSELISGQAGINIKDVFNCLDYMQPWQYSSILLACVATGNLDLLKFIVKSGLIENLQSQLQSALFLASLNDHVNIVEYLILLKVDVNYQNKNGQTALQTAAQQGSNDCFEFLLSHGANPILRNEMGNDALDLALLNGNHVAVDILLKGDLQSVGYTELMLAILDNDFKKISSLLKSTQSKITELTKGGFTTLMIAAMQFADATDEKIKNKLFDLILQLIPRSDPLHINKIKFNFLQLLKSAKENHTLYDLTSEQILKLYDACSTTDFIKQQKGKNFLHLCTILGFDFSDLYEPIFSKAIPTSDLDMFINALDYDGNSPLSYLLFDTEQKFSANHILTMVSHGAKFIRNGVEFKQSQHIKVMLTIDGYLKFTPQELKYINVGDEDGRTALHLACMRNKITIARDLLTLGARIDQQDRYGRTPLHYAAQNNMLLAYKINSDSWDIADNMGITPLVFAMQYVDDVDMLKNYVQTYTSPVNKILMSFFKLKSAAMLDSKISDICDDKNLNHKQKLAIIAALRNYTSLVTPSKDPNIDYAQNEKAHIDFKSTQRYEVAANRIMQEEFESKQYKSGIMPKGYAIGIELEIPGLAPHSFISTPELARLYSAELAFDVTVTNTWLSSNILPNTGDKLELVSEVLNTYTKYEQFIDLCKTLNDSGATINPSAGMHVHFNCRGSTLTTPPLERFVPQKQELDYLKYVALNYIRVENLLRGFMRGGALYNLYGSAYVQGLSEYETEIKNCKTVDELQNICSHNKTLDFTALNRHGTIEFRLHDATVDPILINAWVDCLSRLVSASRTQAEQHKTGQAYESIPNIEELVTLLITMRQYNTSWDPKWGAFKGSETVTTSAYPGKDSRPVQVQIQESPLYKLAHLFINYDKNETRDAKTRIIDFFVENNNLFADGAFDKNSVLKDLKDLLLFTRDNPGLLANSPDIEPAIDAINALLSRNIRKI